MNRTLRHAALALALFLGLLSAGAARSAEPALDASAVDALVEEALKKLQVPGAAVAVVRGDQVVHLKGFGVREAGKTDPVTPDTLFAAGSATKAFTTAALAMLVDEGKLAWDDPLRKHLEYFRLGDPLAEQEVTLRDAVTHRTGLSRHDGLWYASPYTRDEILRRIGQVKLARSFRSTFQYHNIMYLAAGMAAASASGTTWEELVRRRIFEPLGMTGACFSTTVAEKAPDRATPHLREKDGTPKPIAWQNIDNIGPAGSINAGARDLAQWVRFHLGNGTFEGKKLVSAGSLEETRTPQVVVRIEGPAKAIAAEAGTTQRSYGMGWFIEDYRGQLLVSHGGNIDGFTARVALLPRAKLGIVVLANLNNTSLPTAVSHAVTDLALGLPKKDWNGYFAGRMKQAEEAQASARKTREAKRHKDTKPSRELTAYAGTYAEPAYGTVTASVEDGALVLRWSRFKAKLGHWHFDTFSVAEGQFQDALAHFTLGPDGEVATLSLLGTEYRRSPARP